MNQQILAKKKDTVGKLNDLLKNSHSAVIVSYSGLAVSEVNQLRTDLKKAGAKLSVRKNSLMKKAIDEDGLSKLDSCLKGPSAIVTSKEEGAGLQVLKDFEASHKKFQIKGGMIDGTFCDEAKLNQLAAIGSKENAISIFLSTLQSPLTQFALILKALSEKAPSDAAAPAAAN
ncbi:MAG: 50S ribosomal protein L10 [Bacilli bacterium]